MSRTPSVTRLILCSIPHLRLDRCAARYAMAPTGRPGPSGLRCSHPWKERDVTLEAPEPQAIVVFGASGDLTRKKILPALYNLFAERLPPRRHAIARYACSDCSDQAFRDHAGLRRRVLGHGARR